MRILVSAACLCCCAWTAAPAASPVVRAAVPADGRIVLTDYGVRAWGPELVHYTVDTARFVPGRLALIGPDGRAVPFQIDDGVLSFVASLPRGQSAAYSLGASDTDRSGENTALSVRTHARSVEIDNGVLAVLVPPAGVREYATPAAADAVPPPLLSWRPAGLPEMGACRFATTRRIAATSFRMVRNGPACVEYEARYTFAPRGQYVLRLRMANGVPLAHVVEEFDMGEVTGGEDLLLLDLHRGFEPRSIAWVAGAGEQQMPQAPATAYDACVRGRRGQPPREAPVGGRGTAPRPLFPENDAVYLESIVPGGRWGGLKGGVRISAEPPDSAGGGRSLSLVPLHVGSWRRAMALTVWHRDKAGLAVALPISVRPLRWSLETTDDFSPFSTHEHDEGLPRTFGRREWCLYCGDGVETVQARFGHIGLDRYKDWIIEHPETPAAASAFPGGWFRREHVERLRRSIDRHPSADALRKRYLLSGNRDDAIRNARSVIDGLKKPYGENDFFISGLSNYRKAQLLVFVNEAEDALACPDLPADLRAELRRWLTLYAYVTSDPDWNPRGAGVHLGNNNMPINRTLALAYFAALLPDHPCCPYWLEQVRQFTRFKLATQFSPHGESIECPTYQLYAPAGALNIAHNVLRNRRPAEAAPEDHLRRNLQYLANLTVPDARWKGARIIPGMGNSANHRPDIWGASVATFADHDPGFAGWLRSMFHLAGARFGAVFTGVTFVGHPMYYLPDVPPSPVNLRTAFMPAYGVVFRAHFNTPGETVMLLRAGVNWGHWDTDALNVILYARGAPLSPGTGYQYYSGAGTRNNAVYHNRVKAGRRDLPEVFGRVDCAVADYGFAECADYAVAERYYPPELFDDGGGEMSWRRHVVFVKSRDPRHTSYFVMRDTFPGGQHRRKWWTWLNLDMPDRVAVDGRAFAADAVPVETVLAESDMPSMRGQRLDMATQYGVSTHIRFAGIREMRIRQVLQYPRQDGLGGRETKTVVESPAGAGEDFQYVVWPCADGEQPPQCQHIAPGAWKIAAAGSTDYVFIADAPMSFDREGVLFEGKAGVVRVSADEVVISMLSGSGRAGFGGAVFEGHGPFERRLGRSAVAPGVTRLTDGYPKDRLTIDAGDGARITGEGPFTASVADRTIRISARGRARVLYVTQPPWIIRPQLWIDGTEWMPSWTDYPASGWGTYRNTWLMALSVPDGEHELVVKDFTFPPVWRRPFVPLIDGVARRQ